MKLHRSFRTLVRPVTAGLLVLLATAPAAAQTERMYFPAVENVTNVLVQRINAETQRIDMSAWYLSEGAIVQALLARHRAGIQIRLIGDRGSIFEIDAFTKNAFYELAAAGVPIRLRYNPTWFPEIAHWKATIFVGQGIVTFGSANYTPFELAPVSSTNYKDETVLFTNDVELVRAFKTKFDRFWNDTTTEPESRIGGPPYFRNWDDACAAESACSDYRTRYPNPVRMLIDTRRLESDYAMPADMVWGQGPSFNNRLVQEINDEFTRVDFVIYRLTVDNITQALLAKHQSGVPVRLIIEPNEYLNRKWPEFWLTHANIDKLWAAGVQIKSRRHDGLTHMKMLVTSEYATNASSNLAANWQRDHNYFVPARTKPALHQAMRDRFQAMWTDTTGFATFVPQRPDAASLVSPASGSGGVATNARLTWNAAPFATNYDVYIGTSSSTMTLAGNVPAQLVQNPPTTYSFTASLQAGTTYFWQVVSRTNATPRNASLVASSAVRSFTTSGTATPPPSSSLPTPWVSQDLGAVGTPGSAGYSSGVFTVRGAGADIWGSADAFHFAYRSLSGDGQIVARVTGVPNTHSYAKAGIMLRAGTAAGAAHVILDVRPNGSVEFMTRGGAGGTTTYLAGASQPAPTWLRLQRSGGSVTAAVSSNGSTWTTVGSTSVSFSSTLNAGLAVTSHNTGVLNASTFDNVSVTTGGVTPPPPPPPTSSLPTPWQGQDIGAVGTSGSASYSSGIFTVRGAGADIWGTSDAFHFVYQSLAGDGVIVARVSGVQNTNSYAKAGVMLRSGLTAGASHVILDVRPGGSIEFMQRGSNGGATSYLGGANQGPPAWLRLSRSGSLVTAAVSSNGSTWTTIGSTSVAFGSTVYAGLVVNSHDTSTLNASTFDNVSVSAGSAPPPPPPPTSAPDIVIYASDIPASALRGSWSSGADGSSPNGVKLLTSDSGFVAANAPLAGPADYFDFTVNAQAGVPYRIWLRLRALSNSKYNDAIWVQFSNAQVNGSRAYAINSASGLLVNLATDGTGGSLNNWGWQNGAYWLSQATAVTFPVSGAQTIRIQVREDGVQLDQVVLSPSRFFNSAPGGPTNDGTIVAKGG